MQCPSCKAEWNLNNYKSSQLITKCPFCGKNLSLQSDKNNNESIAGILRSLVSEYGAELYSIDSAQRFKALLADLANNFPKERKLLNLAISEQIPSRLLAVSNKSDDEKQNIVFYCKKNLVEDYSIDESIAVNIVNMLVEGLTWNKKMHVLDFSEARTDLTVVQTVESTIQKKSKNEFLVNKKNNSGWNVYIFPNRYGIMSTFHRADCTEIKNYPPRSFVGKYSSDKKAELIARRKGSFHYCIKCFQLMKNENQENNNETNFPNELKELLIAAKRGDSDAQEQLCYEFLKGKNIGKDYNKAIYWLKQSALQGNPYAQGWLGYMYLDGIGVPQDYYEAFELFKKAALQGNREAQEFLRKVTEKNNKKLTLEEVCENLKRGNGKSFITYLKSQDIVLSDGTYNEIKQFAEQHDIIAVRKYLLKYAGVRGEQLEDILSAVAGDYKEYKVFKGAPETCPASSAYWFHDYVNNRHLWGSKFYPAVKYCPKCFKKVKKIDIPCPNCGCDFKN